MSSIEINERDIPDEDSHDNLLDRPHSIVWRLFHGTCYLFGGLFFICGSCMYFVDVMAKINRALEIGAWLFVIGSTCFLLADLQDWFYYQFPFLLSSKCRKQKHIVHDIDHVQTSFHRYRRIKIDMNYFTSILGSLLYLVGSIFFLPKFGNEIIVGDALFIVGSAVIYLSEGWKIYRLACTNTLHLNDTSFHLQNILYNLQAVFISFFAGLGGVFYFVGTILFLPQFTTTDFGENRAAGLFLCGGIFFSLAGLLLQYRYYCRNRK